MLSNYRSPFRMGRRRYSIIEILVLIIFALAGSFMVFSLCRVLLGGGGGFPSQVVRIYDQNGHVIQEYHGVLATEDGARVTIYGNGQYLSTTQPHTISWE